ncbi:MAG: 50S ribosomal protein L3 [Treponema sp.]
MIGLIGKKVGMTQVFDEAGNVIPVTVIKVEPNTVVSIKEDKNKKSVVMLGVGKMKKVSRSYQGQFAEGKEPLKLLKEFKNFTKEVSVGDVLGVDAFDGVRYVDATAVSKGKGFQGVMKRWGYAGGPAAHGSKFHREAGSTGQCTTPGRSFKNTTMPGRMGREQVTVQNLKVVKIDRDLSVVMVRGAVPGHRDTTVFLKSAVKREVR